MVAHPKPKRTMRHGLRLTPQHKIADSLQKPAQKVIEMAKKALGDSQPLDERQRFLLTHILKASERLLAPAELKEKLGKELENRVDEGEQLRFSVEEISGMNAAAFLIDNGGWLNIFIEQTRKKLEGKMAEVKK